MTVASSATVPPLCFTIAAAHLSLQPSMVMAGALATVRRAPSSPRTSMASATIAVVCGRSSSTSS